MDNNEIIMQADMMEQLIGTPAWLIFHKIIKEKIDGLERGTLGRVVTDAAQTSYDNGKWQGLKDCLDLPKKLIEQRNRIQEQSRTD